MTQYNSEQIAEMRKAIMGARVIGLIYEPDEDYYVMEFEGENGSVFETCFRYMTDLSL